MITLRAGEAQILMGRKQKTVPNRTLVTPTVRQFDPDKLTAC